MRWRSCALWFTRQWAASFEGGKRNLSLWAEYKPLVAAGNKVQLFVSTLQCIVLILSAEPWTEISWVLLRSLNLFLLFLSDLKECIGQTIKCVVGSCRHSYVQTSLHMISSRERGEMTRTCFMFKTQTTFYMASWIYNLKNLVKKRN